MADTNKETLVSKLTDIADGFRTSRSLSETLSLDEMAVLAAVPIGGGGGNEPTNEELTLTGNCECRFANGGWDWVIAKYGNRITTTNITQATKMFSASNVSEIPFPINVYNCQKFESMFYDTNSLKVCPKIRGSITWNTSTGLTSSLSYARNMRDWEDLFTPEMLDDFSSVKITGAYSAPKCCNFQGNYSLRRIPSWWYKFKLREDSTAFPSSSYSLYVNAFQDCYVIDEIVDIPVWTCGAAATSNMFTSAFNACGRVSRITFETNDDGTPKVTKWKSQVIDLSGTIGYNSSPSNIDNYNSGITADKLVNSDTTYQALKNDPDWYTILAIYSRYNHESAVETINSLPDTSAYLATAGGTNTIKFKGGAGQGTDEGAINTLTEAEIAIATAKGWTVTLS